MITIRNCLFVVSVLCSAGTLFAQAPAPEPPPACRVNLDSLQSKIETNYAGFILEVRDSVARRRGYDALLASLRARADTTAESACFPVLDALTSWFHDPHLFIYQSVNLDTAESRRRQATVEHRALDEAGVRRLVSASRRPDPIEGIWYDGRLRLGVVRDSMPGRFVAVVLVPDTSTWHAGDVRARFVRQSDGAYDATVAAASFGTRRQHATLHKRVLLRLSPGMWGKTWPVAPADSGILDTIDAHRPTLVVRGATVIVSLTSHDPGNRPLLDSLLARNAEALLTVQRLIVDVRGNEGGSSWMSDGLLPYILSDPPRPAPPDTDRAVMLSSPAQIRYVLQSFGDTTSAFVSGLLSRMRAAPGQFVPLEDPAAPPEPPRRDSIRPWPRRVAVLIDGGTVSASEVLVLKALRSTRAQVFGTPTEGALDYQSTSILRLAPGERRWYFGYPTITAHTRLPAGGMRGKGIAPDVRVDWRRLADPFAAIERMLR